MPLNGTDQNGEPTQLPQFNLSPSGHHDSPEKEEMDMEDEEKDTMGDMPDIVEPLMSFNRQPTGLRMHSLTHSATRLGRLNSSMRAASSLQKSFSNMNNSAGHSQFKAQRSSVLERLTSETGRDAGKMMVTSASFEDAVVQRIGSNVFAQRLFESQNPEGAAEVPAERLVDALLTLEHASLEDHLRITFELLDTRGDGSIARENLEEILKVAFAKLKIPVTDRQLERVAEALFKDIKDARDTTEQQLGGINEEEALQEAKMARINSGMVTETVHFDELVRLLKNHIEEVEQHHKTSKPMVDMRTKARKLMYRILGFGHLPFWFCFWAGMAFAFFAGYWQNYQKPDAHVSGAAYPLAKAFAQVIQPLSFLLLFAVCRRTMTALRNTLLRYIFPFDECISFHRLCGYLILLCSAGHTICHIGNFVDWAAGGTSSHSWVKTFGTPPPTAISLWGSETAITGYIMWFALLIGYFFAMWYPRKAKKIEKTAVGRVLNNFTYFSITHIAMWFIFYVALILHPLPGTPSQHANHHSTTWIYVALPFVLYVAERVWRLIRNVAFKGDLLDVELLPGRGRNGGGGVTVLRMRRPRDFNYRPGMYLFINVPGISVMEWHPFTITSAPGDPYVSVHIRDAGDWTHALYDYMLNYAKGVEADLPPPPKGEALRMATFKNAGMNDGVASPLGLGPMGGVSLARSMTLSQAAHSGKHTAFGGSGKSTPKVVSRQATFVPGAAQGLTPTLQRRRTRASLRACNWDPLPDAPLVLLDGPYSAPAMRWEDYEVVVLVGAGIGVTPFASVLADMVNKLESNVCEECGHVGHSHLASGVSVEKIYFHWVVGDTSAPNYFASTLETISSDDQLGLVEPRIHLTAVKPSTEEGPDLHNIFVKLGQEALHRQQGIDVVIGLKSKVVTQFGRPNWPHIIADVADNHPGQTVGVFVCGPPPFTKSIKHACEDFNASASTRIKVIDEEGPDLEAGEPALKKTVFSFYEEYF